MISPGKTLEAEVVKLVLEFYLDDEISATMPGKKDVLVVKNEHGNRQELRKILLLGTLRELYATFKERHPVLKIGFIKFATLRPQECVFVSSCGTHTVCVCTRH